MSSVWQRHAVAHRVTQILERLSDGAQAGHHLGHPFLTAYQIAILLHARYPALAEELRVDIGGRGGGVPFTLASYIGRELTRHVQDDPDGRIEGAFLSGECLTDLRFAAADGREIVSSLTGTRFNPSLFRLRARSADDAARTNGDERGVGHERSVD